MLEGEDVTTMISDTQTDKPADEQSDEQKLGNILNLLQPPQQPYDELADRASGLLPYLPRASIERALARYFELFAAGYDTWQGCYDYPRIHEYFYGAYLQAIQKGGSGLSPQLRAMLEQMTEAMVAYTWCENALICNDPQGLLDSATRATEYGAAALQSLDDSSLGPLLRPPIEQYLQMNIDLWSGFKLCAEMYLASLKNETIPDATLSDVKGLLKSLEAKSRELASELRAHFSFAQRLAQAYALRNSDLRVNEGTLLLRASGYVGEDLTAKLFKQFAYSETMPEDKLKDVREKTGLPIFSVRPEAMHDIFETILGRDYLKPIIFELSTEFSTELSTDDNKHALTFTIRDGERELVYPVEKFQVRLARFGTISVEFEISLEGTPLSTEEASVSRVRLLNSLIAPYAGRFDFIWRNAPPDIGRESTNYVDYFVRSQKWIKSIRNAMQNELSLTAAEEMESMIAEMESVCDKWREELCELAECLRPGFTETLNGTSEQVELSGHDPKARTERAYQTLHQECFLCMRKLAWLWIQEYKTMNSLEEVVQEGNRLFPPGVRYGHLMDIADEVLNHIILYFSSEVDFEIQRLSSEEDADVEPLSSGKDVDVRQLFSFDPNTGWATILLCSRLTIDERDGTPPIEPMVESDYYRVAAHPEFKGFIIQPREARSGLFDWLFVAMPAYRNLATIRSHETDAMYIGENHAFLYLPDEPQYLADQYVETFRLMDDVRTLVRSFNTMAKKQIENLEEDFKSMAGYKSYQIAGKSMSKFYDYLSSRRDKIEDFRTHSEKILDLIRSTTISRYQDHSELLKEMIKESRVDDIRNSLEHNIAVLDRFHAYLTERLRRKMDESADTFQKAIVASQSRINKFVAFLTGLSTLSAILAILLLFVEPTVLRTFLVSLLNRMIWSIEQPVDIIGRIILLIVLLAIVLLGRIAVSLIAWLLA
jgi:hypothetical protein